MPFAVGADVIVTSLQKRGRVVDAAARGRYRVAVGGMTIWCHEADLVPAAQARKPGRRARRLPAGGRPAHRQPMQELAAARERRALASLDLHGLTVPEALQAVEVRVDQAIRAGLDRVEIIHGISGGRLRAAVRRCLAGMNGVRSVPDPKNAGVTWVCFTGAGEP